MELHDRIRQRRKELNLSQEELAKMLGYKDRSSIARIELGANNLTQSKIEAFAKALATTPGFLMGWTDEARLNGAKISLRKMVADHPSMPSGERLVFICDAAGYSDEEIRSVFYDEVSPWFGKDLEHWMGVYQLPVHYLVDEMLSLLSMTPEELLCEDELPYYRSEDYEGGISFPPYMEAESVESYEWSEPEYPGVTCIDRMAQTPLLGRIACGEPILAEENIEDYVDLPKHIKADFALECKGDSMIGAGIQDGDIVYIRQQPTVENGQIAAVLIDGDEATLKRFYFDGKTVQLVAENPKYPPKVFVGEDVNKIRVIGWAVAFTHSLV